MSFGRAFRLVAVALGGIAVVLALVCVVNVVRTRAFLSDSVVTTGRVVELVSRQSCEDDRDQDDQRICTLVYAPRVAFTTADGRDVVFVSGTASSPPSYAEGDVVDVRYRTARPAEARIDSVGGVWIAAIITGALALVFGGLCAVWVVLAVKFRKE